MAAAIETAARARLGRFMQGVTAYRRHGYSRPEPDYPVIWREGAARLIDYGAGLPPAAPAVLAVASLVNRSYILDLAPDRSLMRYLRRRGIRPLLLDWGTPGAAELAFTVTDYVAGPLEAALEAATAVARGPVGLVGYCMGGLLAVALALRRPQSVRHLALIATPWDFHADHDLARRVAAAAPGLAATLQLLGHLPLDLVQTMFYALDPFLVVRKFIRAQKPDAGFVALEDWLNDGVALAGPVARECLLGWYAANTTMQGGWRVAGRIVDPAAVRCPVLVVVPTRDRIVPPDSALALAAAMPGAKVTRPRLGHIAMMATAAAPEEVWAPLTDWIEAHG